MSYAILPCIPIERLLACVGTTSQGARSSRDCQVHPLRICIFSGPFHRLRCASSGMLSKEQHASEHCKGTVKQYPFLSVQARALEALSCALTSCAPAHSLCARAFLSEEQACLQRLEQCAMHTTWIAPLAAQAVAQLQPWQPIWGSCPSALTPAAASGRPLPLDPSWASGPVLA